MSPRHPRFGVYDLNAILEAFRAKGFIAHGAIRPKSQSTSDAADELVRDVRSLLDAGVPAETIAVVGGSMGGGIALLASARLANPDLRFAVLGVCLSANVTALTESEGRPPAGRVLAIRESSDETTRGCEPWPDSGKPAAPDLRARELVVNTGLEHGFLYRPLAAWVEPTVSWALEPRVP